MSSTTGYLAQIMVEAVKLGIDVEGNMFRGATMHEISQAANKLPFSLPCEVVDLYLWRNGVRLEGQTSEFRFFPKVLFQPLEDSVETTRILISSSDDPDVRWRKAWYCLFADLAGDYYAIDVLQESECYGRIFAVKDGLDPFPAFWSLEAMLKSNLECYKAGAYYLGEDGFLDERIELSDLIYRAFNRGLSPLKTLSNEKLLENLAGAKRKFEFENRPDLLKKLSEFAEKFGINVDRL